MSCVSCNISLGIAQWGGCDCPVWECCGSIREVKASVSVTAAPPATNAGAVDYAPGTVLGTTDGTNWIQLTSGNIGTVVAFGVVVCAPIHAVGQTYPATKEIVLRTAQTGVYDDKLIFPAAFTAAEKALTLARMQSLGFERRAVYA